VFFIQKEHCSETEEELIEAGRALAKKGNHPLGMTLFLFFPLYVLGVFVVVFGTSELYALLTPSDDAH
jgi:hypothetical protein